MNTPLLSPPYTHTKLLLQRYTHGDMHACRICYI